VAVTGKAGNRLSPVSCMSSHEVRSQPPVACTGPAPSCVVGGWGGAQVPWRCSSADGHQI